MQLNEDLTEIFNVLDQKKLGLAIERLLNFGYNFPELNVVHEVEQLRNDYMLMGSYWSKGYKDPQLENQYNVLLCRAYALTADIVVRYSLNHSVMLRSVSRQLNSIGTKWTLDSLQGELENFVADVAMLEFESEKTRKDKEAELYKAHQQLLSDVFDYIWFSNQWTDGVAETFRSILLSPTIDTMAQQLIVSAITLGVMNIFDIRKFKLLVDVYKCNSNELVRQRALVGWVLSIGNGRYGLYPEQKSMICELLEDDNLCNELVELQMQLVYCANAESDNRTIQQEIMPDILKHNNFNIGINGIVEKDDDPMQDIFDSGASERNMEKVEEGFRRMIDMQKQGHDIYFGGFSQMKRYPFFNKISNWFCPYYEKHPDISNAQGKLSNIKLLSKMLSDGTFCNSDKYSFLLAFMQIVDKLPKNVSEMLQQGDVANHVLITEEEQSSATFVRRIYLQDLYRFFRIYPFSNEFKNPFDYRKNEDWSSDYIFFSNSLFGGTRLEQFACKVAAFLVKKKMYREAADVLGGCKDIVDGYSYNLLCGNILLNKDKVILGQHFEKLSAVGCFEKALAVKPESEKAQAGLARALFYSGDYAKARDAYKKLLETNAESSTLILSYCICLVNLAEYNNALEQLFKLHYDYPDNQNVSRVLARALVGAAKFEQALAVYERMAEQATGEDLLNQGYCKWFAGNVEGAAKLFAQYVKSKYKKDRLSGFVFDKIYTDIIKPEHDFIAAHNISEIEMMMMVDVVCGLL